MSRFITPLAYVRRPSRVVKIGSVAVGGMEPIRIQSMLTSDTCDVPQVLQEIAALAAAKCELIRLTVPNQKSVESLPAIRQGMEARGIAIPLIADIHFTPQLAVNACEFVEKVRINPGNYADRKRFEVREYSEAQYAEELERLEEKLVPLILNLKKYGRALRIGTNHGSLSDRIVNRYGDSPEGMVESALEFVRLFEKHDFREIIISMKSSNPLVMLQAYRLLVLKMDEHGMSYPLHLGVTEAGNGLDGRIKSAVGIGSLLCDGIGDTIRVSLTEPAENEVPAARAIIQGMEATQQKSPCWPEVHHQTPIHFTRRPTQPVPIAQRWVGGQEALRFFGLTDYIVPGLPTEPFDALLSLSPTEALATHRIIESTAQAETFLRLADFPAILIEEAQIASATLPPLWECLKQAREPHLLLLRGQHPLRPVRWLVNWLKEAGNDWPLGVLIPPLEDPEQGLGLAAEVGSLIADGLLDALVSPNANPQAPVTEFCQTLLQATRARLFRADFISCPSCGRTFFDLQATTEAIKIRTKHLKGVKIGIMGCIVNGPGEMADADFGYVGSGEDKINLYRGQECVARNIPAGQAVDRLIELIKAHGQWVEP